MTEQNSEQNSDQNLNFSSDSVSPPHVGADLDVCPASENQEKTPESTGPVKSAVILTETQQKLITQIKSMRALFDQAHEKSMKAQEAFDLVKHGIHQTQLLTDQEIVSIKSEGETEIYSILQELESYKRQIQSEVAGLRDSINQMYRTGLDPELNDQGPAVLTPAQLLEKSRPDDDV